MRDEEIRIQPFREQPVHISVNIVLHLLVHNLLQSPKVLFNYNVLKASAGNYLRSSQVLLAS